MRTPQEADEGRRCCECDDEFAEGDRRALYAGTADERPYRKQPQNEEGCRERSAEDGQHLRLVAEVHQAGHEEAGVETESEHVEASRFERHQEARPPGERRGRTLSDARSDRRGRRPLDGAREGHRAAETHCTRDSRPVSSGVDGHQSSVATAADMSAEAARTSPRR